MHSATGESKRQNDNPTVDAFQAIERQFHRMRDQSRNAPPWSYEKRMRLLGQLECMLKENETTIINMVDADFGGKDGGRGLQWSRLTDGYLPLSHIKHVKEHLKSWIQEKDVHASFPFNLMGRAFCMYQPLGVVLCIAPWNFPVLLLIGPLAELLGAGNRAVLKPSESAPQTSALISRLVSTYFPDGEVVAVEGDYRVAQYLTSLPFDHIVFTGSTNVAKKIMKSASQNLVPLTLELGGKSPVLVAPDYPISAAAKSIIDSKLGNAGQLCVGVDYVLIPKGKADEFADVCARRVLESWGETGLENNAGYTSIINAFHYNRIKGLVADARKNNARVVSLDPTGVEEYSGKTNRFPPTLILPPFDPNKLEAMQREIFGPVIPVIEIDSIEEAVVFINRRPRPLALYVFTNDKNVKKTVLTRTTSGGVTINEIAFHVSLPVLPFGGIGPSGMGKYHGETGFRNFSNMKSVYEHKRMLIPSVTHPLAKKDVDQIFLTLKLQLGKTLKKTCSVVCVIVLASIIWYCKQNYEISIIRKF